jgi:hypothetical protein
MALGINTPDRAPEVAFRHLIPGIRAPTPTRLPLSRPVQVRHRSTEARSKQRDIATTEIAHLPVQGLSQSILPPCITIGQHRPAAPWLAHSTSLTRVQTLELTRLEIQRGTASFPRPGISVMFDRRPGGLRVGRPP